jgi:hypothetical protein
VDQQSEPGADTENVWIKIARQQAALLASLGDRLGLDPKSRATLKLPDARQRNSKFAGLIGGGVAPGYKNQLGTGADDEAEQSTLYHNERLSVA